MRARLRSLIALQRIYDRRVSEILVAADAGPDAGLGHLSRSGAIALALAEGGRAVRCLGLGAPEAIVRDGVRWEPAGQPPRWRGVMLLDSYRLDPGSVAGPGTVLAVLHDGDAIPAEAALAISVNEPEAPAPAGVELAAGPEYAALRPQFRDVPAPEIPPRARQLLVTTGSSDAAAPVGELAAALRERTGARLTAVVGPYSDAGTIEADETLIAPSSLLEALAATDLVVCAAGQTMLEALACGTPYVAVPFVDNQRRQAEMLAGRGAVVVAGSAAEAADLAARLADDRDERRRLSEAGRHTIDGRGAERAAAEIAALTA